MLSVPITRLHYGRGYTSISATELYLNQVSASRWGLQLYLFRCMTSATTLHISPVTVPPQLHGVVSINFSILFKNAALNLAVLVSTVMVGGGQITFCTYNVGCIFSSTPIKNDISISLYKYRKNIRMFLVTGIGNLKIWVKPGRWGRGIGASVKQLK